ncbi:MAG: hypothetical protein IJU12_02160 [Clostridia bacterium]|nr:hypothetical protein [Clostridia bacterium]
MNSRAKGKVNSQPENELTHFSVCLITFRRRALRGARPALLAAREWRRALFKQHAEATMIVSSSSIAGCFFAAFFSEESADSFFRR